MSDHHPIGTVTFLITDIEGSTRLRQAQPDAYVVSLALHDALLGQSIEAHGGYVFKTIGDAFCAAFATAEAAVVAAVAAQRSLQSADWGLAPIRVRMALQTGAADFRKGDYYGFTLARVARLLSAGYGGQTLFSAATQALMSDRWPPGISAQDLGEHRLKDLVRPEHVFQLVVPGLPADFPPLKTLEAYPHNLPLQPTPLIGREHDVAAATTMLGSDDVRLLTLTGPGGTGKTRLALQVAAEVLDQFRHGVFFVNLAPVGDSALVLSTIGQTLGIQESGNRVLADSLKVWLYSKEILLLLDNFEHLVQGAPGLAELLVAAPALKVLVTSRMALQLRGEHEFAVAPLPVPNRRQLPSLDQLIQYESVRLFIERARAVQSDFEVTNESAPAVAEICARLDGLPLAIELAAARVRLLTPQAMLARLGSRLRLLTGGSRDLPARQQTLRSTIAWSHDLLDPAEQTLFRRLAVFVGGRTLEAIEAVCSAAGGLEVDVLDGTQSLIAKSLLRQEPGAASQPRFAMLETIHEYAREKLTASDEFEQLRQQHAQYFLAFAEEADQHLRGPQQAEWLQRVDDDHENLRAALAWAIEHPALELAAGLATALIWFWWLRGYWTEGRQWLSAVLEMVGRSWHTVLGARTLCGLGMFEVWQSSFGAGRDTLEQSLALARELNHLPTIADAARSLGIAANFGRDYAAAQTLFGHSLAAAQAAGDPWRVAMALTRVNLTPSHLGNTTSRRARLLEALAILRNLGDLRGIGDCLNNLGEIARTEGDYATARSYYEESLKIHFNLGNTGGTVGLKLTNLGYAAYHLGDFDHALRAFRQALGAWSEIGSEGGIVLALTGMAGVAAAQGQPERAAHLLGAVTALLQSTGDFMEPVERADYEAIIADARARLDSSGWESAQAQGRAMTIDQVVRYARDDA